MSVLFIAEVGINWNNDLQLAHRLIRAAKLVGANVAKFQIYSATHLFGPDGQTPNASILDQVKWMDDVSLETVMWLQARCDEEGIEFAASAFDEERLGWLEQVGVKRHKLASRTVKYDMPYCLKVLSLGKPVVASLGMWRPEDSVRVVPFWNWANVRYMYCVSEYPTLPSNLYLPDTFHDVPSRYAGFSDHTIGVGAALAAIGRGATIIEKHLTLDKALPGPDHACSATPEEFALIVKVGKQVHEAVKHEAVVNHETVKHEAS